jgi:UDP-N-acetylglucosamine transferase subunit ALG13
MFPFDRLVRAADDWAWQNPNVPVFIQTGGGEYRPQHAQWTRMMPIAEYRERLTACKLFVAHVGMGSILQALELRKQQLLLPRRQTLGEHTTDHQLDTARRLHNIPGLRIVEDVDQLHTEMTQMLRTPVEPSAAVANQASAELLGNVANFLKEAF